VGLTADGAAGVARLVGHPEDVRAGIEVDHDQFLVGVAVAPTIARDDRDVLSRWTRDRCPESGSSFFFRPLPLKSVLPSPATAMVRRELECPLRQSSASRTLAVSPHAPASPIGEGAIQQYEHALAPGLSHPREQQFTDQLPHPLGAVHGEEDVLVGRSSSLVGVRPVWSVYLRRSSRQNVVTLRTGCGSRERRRRRTFTGSRPCSRHAP
jgi:hypothetical protein